MEQTISDYLVEDNDIEDTNDLLHELSDDVTEYNDDFYENFNKHEEIINEPYAVNMKLPLDIIQELINHIDPDTFTSLSLCSKKIGAIYTQDMMIKVCNNYYNQRYILMNKYAVNYVRWYIKEQCNHTIYLTRPIMGAQLNKILSDHTSMKRAHSVDSIITSISIYRYMDDFTFTLPLTYNVVTHELTYGQVITFIQFLYCYHLLDEKIHPLNIICNYNSMVPTIKNNLQCLPTWSTQKMYQYIVENNIIIYNSYYMSIAAYMNKLLGFLDFNNR